MIYVFISAIVASFFSSVFGSHAAPSLFDIIFIALPFFILSSVLLSAGWEGAHSRILVCAAIVASGTSLLSIYNSVPSILLPREAIISILTLGFWPLHQGPISLLRFLPLTIGLGIYIQTKNRKNSCIIYSVLACAVNAISFITYGYYLFASGEVLENAQDAYRIFISSNINGYWTNNQTERFFASIGGQAENSMQALHGAFVLILALCIVAGCVKLWKTILVNYKLFVYTLPIIFGVILGCTVRMGNGTFADILALILFLVSAGCIYMYWENASHTYLAVAIMSLLLLGWPVAIGFFVALFIKYFSKNYTGDIWASTFSTFVLNASLAWSGLAFGLRDLPVSNWMLRSIFAIAFLMSASWLGKKLLQTALDIKYQVGFIFLSAGCAAFISGQILFGVLLIPLFIMFAHMRTREKYKIFFLDFYISTIFIAFFILPSWISR